MGQNRECVLDKPMTATEYRLVMDAQTCAFVDRVLQLSSDDAGSIDISSTDIGRQRADYDAMCRVFYKGRPPGIKAHNCRIAHVPVRHYTDEATRSTDPAVQPAQQPQIVYFHGGGFVVGGLQSHDDVCAEICATTGFDVIAVAYRVAPESRHPAMFDDAVAVTGAICADGQGPVILCGDSAGGNLAAATAQALRHARIIGQLLIYPSLGPDRDSGSFITHADAPLLTRSDMQYYLAARLPGESERLERAEKLADDPRLYPLVADDFTNLPPTIVVTAEFDPLRDDGHDYCAAITAAGGKACWIDTAGLVHGFLRARGSIDKARRAFQTINDMLTMLGAGAWNSTQDFKSDFKSGFNRNFRA